jgi:hexosaminidase
MRLTDRLAPARLLVHAAVALAALAPVTASRAAAAEPQLIPRPASLTPAEGELLLRDGDAVELPAGLGPGHLRSLSEAAGLRLVLAEAGPQPEARIRFLEPGAGTEAGAAATSGEGYQLTVDRRALTVRAGSPAGRFYALQTALQLLRTSPRQGGAVALPCLRIEDSPRFGWRGFMLDESRHFSGKESVKRLLDAMAQFKLNRLHWHLTDSPGWRLEIKAYPRLTEVGARGSESDRRLDAPAQFYTQEDVRELLAYARERHIAVVPEIDMPGHADAAVLAYPELDGGGFLQKGRTDKWPRFTFNPASPQTLKFLDAVIGEVDALFADADVLHFGGDEVHFGWQKWTQLPEVQALMKANGYTKLEEVEAWFNRRMAASISARGLRVGGWDEIAARDLPRDKTVVFWWRHDKPQILRAALDAGYSVVLCPRRPCYFDFVQDESHKAGRRWGGFNPLEDVYAFPAALALSPADGKQVLGVQACLWTETTITQARRDFLTWPRLVALAEAAWTPQARKDYASFQARLPAGMRLLAANGLGCYDPFARSPEITDEQADKPKLHLD